jgi:hypothetical protein
VWVTIAAWFKRNWAWFAGALAAGIGLFIARSQGKQAGRLEAVTKDVQKTLNDIDASRTKLQKLHQERVDLASKIVLESAERTKALEEDLTPEEVLKRLREKGLVK